MTGGITAGLSASLTGRYAQEGRQALNGLRLWESYANTQGKIGPVRLICYDDESRISRAQQNALRLLREDGVDILFGPYSSSLSIAVAPVAEDNKKVLWNHGGSSDEIFDRGYRYLVGTASPASDYFRGLPRWLARKDPGARQIFVLRSTTGTFSSQVARGIVEAAGAHAVELLPLGSSVGSDADVLVLAGTFAQEVRILRDRRCWPDTLKAIAAVAAGLQTFHREVGQRSEGVIGPSQWEPGVAFANIRGPDSTWFVRQFQARFGQAPEYIAAGGFAMGLVVAECLERAGSLNDEKLREAAAELDVNTFYGRFRIDPATGRQAGHRILLVQWRGGRKVVLDEPALC